MNEFRSRFGLRFKFAVWTIFFVIIVIASLVLYFTQRQINLLKEEVERNGAALAVSLAAAAAEPYAIDEDLTLVMLSANVREANPHVVYCTITDTNEIIKVHPDSTELWGKPFAYAKKLRKLREINAGAGYKVILSLGPLGYDIKAPIVAEDPKTGHKRVLGYVHLGLSRAVIQKAIREAYQGILYVAILFTAIGIIGVFVLTGFIVRDLKRLAEDIAEIGKGNLDHPVQVRSRDEVGMIAFAVRRMAQNLKEAQEKLLETERFKHEVEIAQRIQSILLPRSLPQIPGYQVSGFYRAARLVGGDYYDFVRMAGGRWGFILADVAGKGVGASLIMVMTRTLVNVEAPFTEDPKELLTTLHNELAGEIPEDMFVTALVGVLQPKEGNLRLASAGHNPPVFYRDGKAILLELEGAVLGLPLLTPQQYAEAMEVKELLLKPGDLLVAYTDGVTEAVNAQGEQFGEERLLKVVEEAGAGSAEGVKHAILDALEEFTRGAEQSDDITLLIIKKL